MHHRRCAASHRTRTGLRSPRLTQGLLIASPQLHDPWFEQAVVLLCQYNRDGALGLVINRQRDVSIGEVVERMELPEPANPQDPAWWGGPVESGAGFVVWRGKVAPEEGWNMAGVAVSPSAECLNRLVESGEPFRLCLGYAGWSPGQLDREIQQGTWLFTELDSALIFDTPLDARYEAALALLGLTRETVWMQPIDE